MFLVNVFLFSETFQCSRMKNHSGCDSVCNRSVCRRSDVEIYSMAYIVCVHLTGMFISVEIDLGVHVHIWFLDWKKRFATSEVAA